MNLLGDDLLCEASVIWPAHGEPRLYVSKGVMTREEIGKVVADLIGLAIQWGADQGVHVHGTIKKPGEGG